MAKAKEANVDPFLSLLEWRNTPSSQLHKSPVEIIFGRRTRTKVPIANSQLVSNAAPATARALADAKERQAVYYNRTALPVSRYKIAPLRPSPPADFATSKSSPARPNNRPRPRNRIAPCCKSPLLTAEAVPWRRDLTRQHERQAECIKKWNRLRWRNSHNYN